MVHISEFEQLSALAKCNTPGTLAVISGIEGASYRSLGTLMAIMNDGKCIGTLSSGCIESDLMYHAKTAQKLESPVTVRYGLGSPFLDIVLPCGGALEITLIHAPDQKILTELLETVSRREARTLQINCKTGALSIHSHRSKSNENDVLSVGMTPELQFVTFGKGLEASAFITLVQSASYKGILLSPDSQMCKFAENLKCDAHHLFKPEFPLHLEIDPWTSITLFFHDHDWEPPILQKALESPAFYIGAQGSKQASQNLIRELQELDVSQKNLDRLRGPIGLIPSARDARTLAVSVLAEILAVVQSTNK